jgi:hypothetical protein
VQIISDMSHEKTIMQRHFALKAPCNNCPFRVETSMDLEPGRLNGIISTLVNDDHSTFQCHKTVHHANGGDWDDEGNYVASGNEAMCAGAAIYLEKLRRPTVAMRLGRVYSAHDPEKTRKHHADVISPISCEDAK